MNERIKELAKQAGAKVMERSGRTDYGTLDLDVEKFAELIVRECSYVADEAHYKATGGRTAGGYVRQHFGVK